MSARFLLKFAASIYIGHIIIMLIVTADIVRCGLKLSCVAASMSKFAIAGYAPPTQIVKDGLDMLDGAIGMTDNVLGGIFGYSTAIAVALVAWFHDDAWLLRRCAAALIVSPTLVLIVNAIAAVLIVSPWWASDS